MKMLARAAIWLSVHVAWAIAGAPACARHATVSAAPAVFAPEMALITVPAASPVVGGLTEIADTVTKSAAIPVSGKGTASFATRTNLTHSIQQNIADWAGAAATKRAAEVKLDTTGMSDPDKEFAIVSGLVKTAEANAFKGDLKIFGDVPVDVAEAAYRASEPNFGADIVALASALTANPLVGIAAEPIYEVVQKAADPAIAPAPVAQAA
jgi:hypothetical protein